ncbi:helix-turn-helix domain-containing protein [bacterium]|nr:helix-turn-helix domain-containing protein [bacterium]
MTVSAENLRFMLGMKLKQLRKDKGLSLKELSEKTGLSISYLSEIEAAKKYPKPEKLIQIADALGIAFDEIVSTKVDTSLDPLTGILDSEVLNEFPFEFFGITPREILQLVGDSPKEAAALVRTLLEIAHSYDMRVEQFLFAALRSYQKMHGNYFSDIETAAEKYTADHKIKIQRTIPMQNLAAILRREYGYIIDEITLIHYPELKRFRSIYADGSPPRLILNPKLFPSQKAFLIGREIGYRWLGLKEHPVTSSWLKIESFEQVLNNFRASYFSGALLLNQQLLHQDLIRFFGKKRWNGEHLLSIMRGYNATPEMFFYRLSQLVPKLFSLHEMFYLRFNNKAGSDVYELTKELNMSRVMAPHGIGLNEHYCRRWLSIQLLKNLSAKSKKSQDQVLVSAQRSFFIDSQAEFFVITLARPLVLTEDTNSSISIGFLINDALKENIRFWNDPAIPRVDVNETCERCRLTKAECAERDAPPTIYKRQQRLLQQEQTLQRLLKDMG